MKRSAKLQFGTARVLESFSKKNGAKLKLGTPLLSAFENLEKKTAPN